MKTFLLLIAFALPLCAQNLAVNFHGANTNGIPTNWPSYTRPIGTNTFAPGADAVMTSAELDAHKQPLWPQYRAAVWLMQSNDMFSATNVVGQNVSALRNLFEDFADYERGWQAGTNYNAATVQLIIRKHNAALLRLRPVLQEMYKGD
jgi:hypothetical protein